MESILRVRLRNFCCKLVVIFHLLLCVTSDVWKTTTACYGADDYCCQYKMECTGGKTILLGSLMYGTKHSVDCRFGISDCKTMPNIIHECCTYNASDTFTPFSQVNQTTVFELCEGRQTCSGWAPRLAVNPYSSYVWMQYACVDKTIVTDMCEENSVNGTELFVRFNASASQVSDGTHSSCVCHIGTPPSQPVTGLSSTPINTNQFVLNITLVDLDFQASQVSASSAYLELVQLKRKYDSNNTRLYTTVAGFTRMSSVVGFVTQERVSLNNVNGNNAAGDPRYIVFYATSLPKETLQIKCFKPGTPMDTSLPIYSTSTPSKVSLQYTRSLLPSYSSPSKPEFTTSQTTLSNTSTVATVSPELSSAISSVISTQTPLANASSTSIITDSNTTALLVQTDTSSTSSSLKHSTPSSPMQSSIQNSLSDNLISSKSTPLSDNPTLSKSTPLSDNPTLSKSTPLSDIPTSSKSTLSPTSTENAYQSLPSPTNSTTSGESTSMSTSITSDPAKANMTEDSTTVKQIYNLPTTLDSVTYDAHSANSLPELTKDIPTSRRSNHSVTVTSTEATKDDTSNNGLIIGIAVAAVLACLIIVAVVMIGLCIRIKRKEQIRRNYIRNTNIFYSFPEDYTDNGSMKSESSPGRERHDPPVATIPRSQSYENLGNASPGKMENPVYFDQNKINKHSPDQADTSGREPSRTRMPSDSSYVGETSTETIEFVNGIENADTLKTVKDSDGIKTVSFDPSVYYAQVRKEGKTKF